jgi:hypothetical protein
MPSLANATQAEDCLKNAIYGDVKTDSLLAERGEEKKTARLEALDGWIRNSGDEGFGIDNYRLMPLVMALIFKRQLR